MKGGGDERQRDEKSCWTEKALKSYSSSVWENILLFMWLHSLHMLLTAGLHSEARQDGHVSEGLVAEAVVQLWLNT